MNILTVKSVYVQVAGAGELPKELYGRVMDYIDRLDNFDGPDIASICTSEGLFEEAFAIYNKFNGKLEALGVLVENLRVSFICPHHMSSSIHQNISSFAYCIHQDLDRAKDYATACNMESVWFRLARAQLDANKVQDAIDSYVKSNDPSDYARVIDAAQASQQHPALINFLQMARKKDFGNQVQYMYVCA
jgi:clathrin heavy chain